MPRLSQEKSDARRAEIIDACEALYQSESYHDITMSQVASGVTFGRANIYNYFQCKDEILLALLQREHDKWTARLDELAGDAENLDDERVAEGLAQSLAERKQMLKLLAMNLYDMEQNSRLEKLVEFKRSYARAVEALQRVVARAKPSWDEKRRMRFLCSFLPFLQGIYSYAFHSEKQLDAMREAGVTPYDLDIRTATRDLVLKLLQED